MLIINLCLVLSSEYGPTEGDENMNIFITIKEYHSNYIKHSTEKYERLYTKITLYLFMLLLLFIVSNRYYNNGVIDYLKLIINK